MQINEWVTKLQTAQTAGNYIAIDNKKLSVAEIGRISIAKLTELKPQMQNPPKDFVNLGPTIVTLTNSIFDRKEEKLAKYQKMTLIAAIIFCWTLAVPILLIPVGYLLYKSGKEIKELRERLNQPLPQPQAQSTQQPQLQSTQQPQAQSTQQPQLQSTQQQSFPQPQADAAPHSPKKAPQFTPDEVAITGLPPTPSPAPKPAEQKKQPWSHPRPLPLPKPPAATTGFPPLTKAKSPATPTHTVVTAQTPLSKTHSPAVTASPKAPSQTVPPPQPPAAPSQEAAATASPTITSQASQTPPPPQSPAAPSQEAAATASPKITSLASQILPPPKSPAAPSQETAAALPQAPAVDVKPMIPAPQPSVPNTAEKEKRGQALALLFAKKGVDSFLQAQGLKDKHNEVNIAVIAKTFANSEAMDPLMLLFCKSLGPIDMQHILDSKLNYDLKDKIVAGVAPYHVPLSPVDMILRRHKRQNPSEIRSARAAYQRVKASHELTFEKWNPVLSYQGEAVPPKNLALESESVISDALDYEKIVGQIVRDIALRGQNVTLSYTDKTGALKNEIAETFLLQSEDPVLKAELALLEKKRELSAEDRAKYQEILKAKPEKSNERDYLVSKLHFNLNRSTLKKLGEELIRDEDLPKYANILESKPDALDTKEFLAAYMLYLGSQNSLNQLGFNATMNGFAPTFGNDPSKVSSEFLIDFHAARIGLAQTAVGVNFTQGNKRILKNTSFIIKMTFDCAKDYTMPVTTLHIFDEGDFKLEQFIKGLSK